MSEKDQLFEWDLLNGQSFQDLVCDIFRNEGYNVLNQGIGPDGGIDIILEHKLIVDAGLIKNLKWAVQVKYKKDKNATVKPGELDNIGNILSKFQADGYWLVTNGRVTKNTYDQIRSFSEGKPPNYLTNVWDNSRIESMLLKHNSLSNKYFHINQEEKRILVVDDEQTTLTVISNVLRTIGHDVLIASTEKEAINIAKSKNIDLAILDILLTDESGSTSTNGFDLAAELRQLNPLIKIIYHSAFLSNKEISSKIQVENATFLSKYDSDTKKITETVKEILGTPDEINRKAAQFESLSTYISTKLHKSISKIYAAKIKVESLNRDLLSAEISNLRIPSTHPFFTY